MRLLLVTSEPGWADTLRSLFPSDDIITATVGSLLQNPPLAAAADACLVAESQTSPWTVETLKQLGAATAAPLFALADVNRSQWEEAALFAGAEQIFRRPLKGALLQLAISRVQRRKPVDAAPAAALPARAAAHPGTDQTQVLALWRDFSRVLAPGRDAGALLRRFIEGLRDVVSCTRVIVYVPDAAVPGAYRCADGTGVDVAAFESFRLSARAGLAQALAERGTVVSRRRLHLDAGRDAAIARELAVFGGELAFPVTGAGGLAAIVILGPRISGADYEDREIALIHQGLEPVGVALSTSAAVPEPPLAAEAVLEAMPLAAALVLPGMIFTGANTTFRTLIGRAEAPAISAEDLPIAWVNAIDAALQGRAGSAAVELEHRAIGTPRKVRLTVRRVEAAAKLATAPFLVTVEDIVPVTSGHETDPHSIGNLLQRAGEQLSNEFRNALTPVDIMVQISHESTTTRGELEQLSTQVSTAIHRLRRRIDDLAYLTKSAIILETTTVSAVLRATRERLDDWVGAKHLKRIVWLNEFSATEMMADSRALAVALGELVMNAIEACEGKQVTVTAEEANEAVSFRVRNNGVWSPPAESSGFRHRPFVSSKTTGVGLGVEVETRVAENHGGKLILGPVAPDTVEAILRLPRRTAAVATPRLDSGPVRVHTG